MEEPREIFCSHCKHYVTEEYNDYDGDAGCTEKYTYCNFFNCGEWFINKYKKSKYYCKGYEDE